MRCNVFRTLFIISTLFDRSMKNVVYSAKKPPKPASTTFPFPMVFPMCTMNYVKKYGRVVPHDSVSRVSTNQSDFLSVERVSNEVFDRGYEGSEEFLVHGPKDDFSLSEFEMKISGRILDSSKQYVTKDEHFSWRDIARRNMQNTTAKPTAKLPKESSEPNEKLRNKIELPYYVANDTFGVMFGNTWQVGASNSTEKKSFLKWLPGFCSHMRRIVGGWHVKTIEQLPYMVFLDSGCGGSIIGEKWVITAGHCIANIKPIYVYVGDRELLGGCQYAVSKTHVHPKHSFRRFDLGLLQVDPKFVFSPAVKPIRLPNNQARVGACGIVSGWGTQRFGGMLAAFIKMAVIPVVLRRRCRKLLLQSAEFCAGYLDGSSDTCQGDSGGPFVVDGFLTGITSYGRKCGQYRSPSIYVDVYYYRSWIREKTGI